MKKFITTAMMLSGLVAYAQDGRVGINTAEPKATLDIHPDPQNAVETATTNEGVLVPRLSKTRIANIADSNLTKGELVYVNDYTYTASPTNVKVDNIIKEGFYYYDGLYWQPIERLNPKFDYILTKDGSVLVQWIDKYKEIEIDMNNYADMEDVKFLGTNLFSGSKIKKFTIKDGVTTIGDQAFSDSQDTEVIIPNSITEIKNKAFFDNKKLTALDMPNVTKVEAQAFSQSSVTSVNLPKVTEVGLSAFHDTPSLTSISMPELTVVKAGTFTNVRNLANIELPNVIRIENATFQGTSDRYAGGISGVISNEALTQFSLPKAKYIGSWAVSGFKNLATVDLPEALEIGERAFESPDYFGRREQTSPNFITTLNIPKAKIIGNSAFWGHNLVTLDLPSATYIGNRSFSSGEYYRNGVYNPRNTLKTLNIPLAEHIGKEAFRNSVIETLHLPSARIIEDRAFFAENVTNISRLTTLTLPLAEKIGSEAFANNRATTLDLPNARIINSRAFYTYPSNREPYLSTLTLPLAEEIGYEAFYVHKLTSLDLPEARIIGDRAFYNEYNYTPSPGSPSVTVQGTLKNLTLPKAEIVGKEAFRYHGIEILDLPEVKRVNESAFDCYYNNTLSCLTTVRLPKAEVIERYAFSNNKLTRLETSARYIGEYAFRRRTSSTDTGYMTTLSLPNAEEIGRYAFEDNRIETLDLPNARIIGEYAFEPYLTYANTDPKGYLATLNLPKAETIGRYAFTNNNLTSLDLPEAITIGESAFFRNTSNFVGGITGTLNLPKAETIGNNAFRNHKLTTINLPNVKTIGVYAFETQYRLANNSYGNRLLTEVTIGPNVTSIGTEAFRAHTNYTGDTSNFTVTIQATTPPTFGSNPFPVPRAPGVLTIKVPSASVAAYKAALSGKGVDVNRVIGY